MPHKAPTFSLYFHLHHSHKKTIMKCFCSMKLLAIFMQSPNAKIGKLALLSFPRHARVNAFLLIIWLIENVAVVLP